MYLPTTSSANKPFTHLNAAASSSSLSSTSTVTPSTLPPASTTIPTANEGVPLAVTSPANTHNNITTSQRSTPTPTANISHVRRPTQPSLSQISIPSPRGSFAQSPRLSSNIPQPSPVRRKPVPQSATSNVTRFSFDESPIDPSHPRPRHISSQALASPIKGRSQTPTSPRSAVEASPNRIVALNHSRKASHANPDSPRKRESSVYSQTATPVQSPKQPTQVSSPNRRSSIPVPARNDTVPLRKASQTSRVSDLSSGPQSPHGRSAHSRSTTMTSTYSPQHAYANPHASSPRNRLGGSPPALATHTVTDLSDDYLAEILPAEQQQRSLGLSPIGTSVQKNFASFFGWRTNETKPQQSPAPHTFDASPTTTFSSSASPVTTSPKNNNNNGARLQFGAPLPSSIPQNMPGRAGPPASLDIQRANVAAASATYLTNGNAPKTPDTNLNVPFSAHNRNTSNGSVYTEKDLSDLQQELAEVSAELAASIRREMDLEDEIDRYRSEALALDHANDTNSNRRTSDYYSDSGASSVRYPVLDPEGKVDELERQVRKVEQEKAQIRLEAADVQSRETALKARCTDLEVQLSYGGGEKVRELEGKLQNEQRTIASFESLLDALRQELQEISNDRDNLRDEVVPGLRSRMEGLEASASQGETLEYENARMQQELQSLRNENQHLLNNRRLQLEMQRSGHFSPIAEDGESDQYFTSPTFGTPPFTGAPVRTSSLRSPTTANRPRSESLSRRNSIKGRDGEPMTEQKVKDIEDQRDALHRALKGMVTRHTCIQKDHARAIRRLTAERDNALAMNADTPRRLAFSREVKVLREEVSSLRRRADDALEQKWQCEKGLSGLKMDLDRAEQETSSLRDLLKDNEVNTPDHSALGNALRDLQRTHAQSLEKLHAMRKDGQRRPSERLDQAYAKQALADLRQTITAAEAERDSALREASMARESAELHRHANSDLSAKLQASAARMEQLADQVQSQLEHNALLRNKLASAIERGEQEQEQQAQKIREMQERLRKAEDEVAAAQANSENSLGEHEKDIRQLDAADTARLSRLKPLSGNGASRKNSLTSPPLLNSSQNSGARNPPSPFKSRSPRLDQRSVAEEAKIEVLEKRVRDLERELVRAEGEMQEVVERMNHAQLQVAQLQGERDEAMQQSRRLHKDIEAERRLFEQMIASAK